MSKTTTSIVQTNFGPMKAIHMHVPVGIPTADGGLEIPNRVFLGGIPNETTELELEIFFSDYGTVKDVRIVTDRHTGESKGYGFVTFQESEDISHLLKKQNIIMKGKKLRVRKAIRRNSSQFQNNSDNESPASSENSTSVTTSHPQSVVSVASNNNSTNNNNAESEPVLFIPNYSGHCGPSCANGMQPMNYSSYNMSSRGAFLPIASPHSSSPQVSNFPSNQLQQQFPPNGAPYHAMPSPTCHPVYYVPYNSSVVPHHAGYNYPVYQTI